MSTYSTNLALELIDTGDQAGTWGTTTNTNLGTLIEQAISGYVTQAITDGADTTITIPNGATGVARNMYIEMTGALTAARNLIVPANKKLYFIYNNTTGGYAVTVKVSGQTGVSVPNGKKVVLVNNGTDIVSAENYIASLSLGAALPTASGGTGLTSFTANGAVYATSSSALTTGTLPTASGGTNLTSFTANGVVYASSTSALATGSALVFDGTNLRVNNSASLPAAHTTGNINCSNDISTGSFLIGVNGSFLGRQSSDGSTILNTGQANLIFSSGTYGSTTERARIDSSGNLGLGVTPSAWGSGFMAIELGRLGTSLVGQNSGTNTLLGANWYYNGTNDIYAYTGTATCYAQYNGQHIWKIAPSGTAGNAITFTQAMTLDASGNLGVGTSSPGSRLSVNGSLDWTGNVWITNNDRGIFFDSISSYGWGIGRTSSPSGLQFLAGGSERMRLDSSGNLGINTTSPGSKLDVKGTLRLSGSTSGYVGLAPAAAAGSTTYTLPSADGSSGQFLSTNGSGALSWGTATGIPTGTILDYGGTVAPSGYLACDGSAVSRSTYADLFTAIGTTWGAGNGSTTFNVPDFRRRTAVGSGGTGTATLGNSVGNTGGAETHTLSTTEMPAHVHTNTVTGNNAYVTDSPTGGGFGGGSGIQNGAMNSTGGGGAHNNMQPSAVVLKIIKT